MQERQVLGGRYRLEERLGAGGMSVVWKAFDLVLGRSVAVKVLAGQYATDVRLREGILAEAQAAARVAHPNLASVHDYGESLDREGRTVPYVVMELLVGPTLLQRLASGPLSARDGLRICAEIAEALAAVHAHHLVHRDVKPGNVMLTATGARLVDFGVAATAGAPGQDRDGRIMGTPNYVAPERLLGGPVEPASDVYGLGLLIFRVLTGRLPWPSGEPSLAARAEPAPLPAIDGVPDEIRELYLRCVAMQAHRRPSVGDAAALLVAAVSGLGPEPEGDDDRSPLAAPTTSNAPIGPAAQPGGDAETTVANRRPRMAAVALSAAAATVATVATVLTVTHAGRAGSDPPAAVAPPPTASTTTTAATTSQTTTTSDPTPAVGADVLVVPTTIVKPGAASSVPRTITPPAPTRTPTGWTTFDSVGGSVLAACFDALAYLDSWEPAPGYTVQRVTQGPAAQTAVSFSGPSAVRIVVHCVDGQPRARTETRTPSPSRTRSP